MKWFSVEECLPKEDGNYLVVDNEVVRTCWFEYASYKDPVPGYFHGCYDGEITHWMPFPGLPE